MARVYCKDCKYYETKYTGFLRRILTEICNGPTRIYHHTYFRKIDITKPSIKNVFGNCKDYCKK